MLTDALLVDRVIAGFDDAFEELYRRHAGAAWRLAQAVTGNAHDAADAVAEAFARVLQAVRHGRLDDPEAFRPYLLTATRNAGLDVLRRAGKDRPTADDDLDRPSAVPSPADQAVAAADTALLAQAFRNLPERWRSVLWLTEVEGMATTDVAAQMGMTANGTAQLAVRARAGLRDRYLQAHVRNHARPECRFTVDHLGAYVGGGLSARDLASVDQHLAGCADCRSRRDELADVGDRLRRIVLPIPLTLGALSAERVNAVLTASYAPAGPGLTTRARQLVEEPTPAMQKFVAASAAGVLALGLVSIGLVSDGNDRVARFASPKNAATAGPVDLPDPVIVDTLHTRFSDPAVRGASATAPPPEAFQLPAAVAEPVGAPATVSTPPAPGPTPTPASEPEVAEPQVQAPAPLPDPLCDLPLVGDLCGDEGGESGDAPALPTPDVPTVEVGGNIADQEVAVSVDVDELEVGLVVGPISLGDPAPSAPADQGLEISVGDTSLRLPL